METLMKWFEIYMALPYGLPMLGVLTIFDIILGISKAAAHGVLNSSISREGLVKHTLIVGTPLFFMPFITEPAHIGFMTAAVSAFTLYQAISCAENWQGLGLPFPEGASKWFDDKKITKAIKGEKNE